MKLVAILVAVVQLLSFISLQADSVENEFNQINELRKERKLLVEYLVKQKLAIESPNGILKLSNKLDGGSRQILESENENRMRMFFLIADSENRSPINVGRDFYERRFGKIDEEELLKPKFTRLMRMDGSQVIGSIMAPDLVEKFLKTKGYLDVRREQNQLGTKIIGRSPSSLPTHFDFIEIKATHTGDAFRSNNGFGLVGGYCDIGMASRRVSKAEVDAMINANLGSPLSMEYKIGTDGLAVVVHPDSLVKSMSLYHIGLCFSGDISKWTDLGYRQGAIITHLPHSESGTSDVFNQHALRAFNLYQNKNVNRFTEFTDLGNAIAQQKNGIGVMSMAQVDENVKALSIRMAKGAYSVEPRTKHVRSQGYPLTRPLYFYLSNQSNEFARSFVQFAMSDEGQGVVNDKGFVGRLIKAKRQTEERVPEAKVNGVKRVVETKYHQLIYGAKRERPWNLRFSQGSKNKLSENSVADLKDLHQYLSKPENRDQQVILIGFTDGVGNDWTNQKLSKSRAEVVAAKVRDWGVSNIRTEGFGEAIPIGDNNTVEGRNANRRVEVWVK